MSFSFSSPSKFRAFSSLSSRDSILDEKETKATTTTFGKMSSFFKSPKKGTKPEEKVPEKDAREGEYDPLSKSYKYVRATYASVKSTTSGGYPRTHGLVMSVEGLVLSTVLFAFSKLSDERQAIIKGIDVDEELLKADDKINPVLKDIMNSTTDTMESAKATAEVVYKVKPYVDSVAKYLPVEQAQQLTVWVMKQAMQHSQILLSIVRGVPKGVEEGQGQGQGQVEQ
jgi:hypothetical protein